jgi:hypothetical protein
MNIHLKLPPEPPTWLGVILSAVFTILAILAIVLLHVLTR